MSTILIVDDKSTNRDLLKTVLSETGNDYVLIEADSGPSALKAMEKDAPDIILLDVMMPEMGGLEATQEIRKNISKDLPIIALTAMTKKEDKEKCLEAGMTDYLPKPIALNKLKEKIIQYAKKT